MEKIISYVLFLLLLITGARSSQAQTTSKIICEGSSITLLGPSSPGVKWFRDGKLVSTTKDLMVKSAGEYVVVAISQYGCESDASLPTKVIVSIPPAQPKVDIIQPNCVLSTGTITVQMISEFNTYSIDGLSYQKSNVFSGLKIGSYTVYAKNENGCISAAQIVNLIKDQPTGDFTSSETNIAFGGTVNFTANVPGAISYEWNFGDGGISYEENPKHYYYKEGSFTVTLKVKTSGSCDFTVSKTNYVKVGPDNTKPDNPVITIPTGIDNTPIKFFAYPNPFKEKLNISISSEISQMVKVELIDMRGNILYSKDHLVNPGNGTITITKFPAMGQGMYTLKVTGQGIKYSTSLLKI